METKQETEQRSRFLNINAVRKATDVTGRKMRIAETEYALQELTPTNPGITMQDIKTHNAECDGYEEGWKAAMKHVKKELDL